MSHASAMAPTVLGLAAWWAGMAAGGPGPFGRFELPEGWQDRFWAEPGARDLAALEPRALATLVPTQAGLRFCRCPACDAAEADDPLRWSPARPEVVTCRKCGVAVPNDKYPAKAGDKGDAKAPEEVVEVRPRVLHKYPYHLVEEPKQAYPDERLYLAAKRDYEAREYLAKAALYAALRSRQADGDGKPGAYARMAAVLVLRFAQVYPAYAVHYDQPGRPKHLQPADLPPPYRRGYQTGKWDWSGCLDVPMNLVIAYALIRDGTGPDEAGRALGDPDPRRTIERDLFRAAAAFVRNQPEEFSESSLYAYRGLLAVGRLLDDADLVNDALARLDGFAERGFYHDGLWRQGDAASHRRVLALIDGWIARLLPGDAAGAPGAAASAMFALAHGAGAAAPFDPRAAEVQRVAWPAPAGPASPRGPALLGGAGLARLAVGSGANALDLELRGLGGAGSARRSRLALRLAVGGRPVLGDLDDEPPRGDGWDRATASHNTVVVDGLNQGESIDQALAPAPGADVRFFAADPDFQVASLEDRFAYPRSTTRYRETVVAAAGARSRYAVAVFEVHGGLQHDWLAHAAAGSAARWRPALAMGPGPRSLLPPTIPFVPSARAEDGRWFVQAFGHFGGLSQGRADRPWQALLAGGGGPGVFLHLLGDAPLSVVTATTPDGDSPRDDQGRAAMILRRRSEDGSTLKTTFVAVFEPVGAGVVPLRRVGRVASAADAVVLMVETAEGVEHLVVNLAAEARAVRLGDGRALRTDGLAVRVVGDEVVLAGGTFAEVPGRRLQQPRSEGTILAASRRSGPGSPGWFEVDATLDDPAGLVGRVLLIRHGDGTTRGWTILRVEGTGQGRARVVVREEPGFALDPATGAARYYQFPRSEAPGPHRFRVARIAR
jgi:hypothetical protein